MDQQQIFDQAVTWMHSRGWMTKLAKSRSGQSLFEHTLIELDVFMALAPLLADRRHYGLSALEQQVLMVALMVHDVGKETDEWQSYISSSGTGTWVSHVLPDLTKSLVPEICAALNLAEISEQVHRTISLCADLHHTKPGRGDASVIESLLSGGPDRFLVLAQVVKAIDHLCSAETPAAAVSVVESDAGFRKHIKLVRHELLPRGVSTALLHRAAQQAFEASGWKPLLYFANGTVYFSSLNDTHPVPSTEEIGVLLKAELDVALNRDAVPLMVGSPTANILPKPELLSFGECRQYLARAGQMKGPQSFARKPMAIKRKIIESYLKIKELTDTPDDNEIEYLAGRISVAQPEMLIFKFFKAMMDPDKVPVIGEDGARLAEKLYESAFGPGTWADLQSTSTLMAARDMAKTVDCFWVLSGAAISHPEVATAAELPDDTRMQVLIGVLNKIASEVFSAIGRPSPRDVLSASMAESFLSDLITPTRGRNVKELARHQLENYRVSKPFAGSETGKGLYLCPICTTPFDPGTRIKASADFLDKPQTHTNRGVSHGSFGYVMVCTSCYQERLLSQLLMGSRPAEIITLTPRLNLGPRKGGELIRQVREWVDGANGALNTEFGFSLKYTDRTAREMDKLDPLALSAGELVQLFRYRFSSETSNKRRKEALQRLKEEFDDDLGALSIACVSDFSDWDAAVEALIAGRMDQHECTAIRREVYRLYDAVHILPETPNMVFVPLSYEIAPGDDESETNKALHRLYVALILSLVFEAAVAIRREVEPFDFRPSAGAACVPAVPAVRSLIGLEWIPVSDARRWLSAIGAAIILARDASLPSRSGVYQALASDPAERLVRRIEQEGRTVSAVQLRLISMLPGFRSNNSQEVRG